MFGDRLQRHERSFEEGEIIFEEGNWGNSIFIIDQGTVEVIKNKNNKEVYIGEIGSGKIIGELVHGSEESIRSATVRAITDVSGWKIRSEKVNKLLETSEKFRQKFVKTISNRLSKTSKKLAKKKEIEEKLYETAFLLLSLIDEETWMKDSAEEKSFSLTHEPEFLAYEFNTSLEKMEDFLLKTNTEDLDRFDPDIKDQFLDIAMRIIRKGRDQIDIDIPFLNIKVESEHKVAGNKQLLFGIRKAEQCLETLKSESNRISRDDYRNIKSDIEKFESIYEKVGSSRKKKSFIVKYFYQLIEDLKKRFANIQFSIDEN